MDCKMNTPEISIIVPCYCVENYLRKCVDSIIINRDYDNVEVILVDDGSSDLCGIICDEYANRCSKITVIHKKNGGLSDARNAGLNIAEGKYIYFVDGDDWLAINAINLLVTNMNQGYDLIAFNYFLYPEDSKCEQIEQEVGEYFLCNPRNRVIFTLGTILKTKIGWSAWSRVFRRDIIENNNLRFIDNKRIFAEDMLFCMCYCSHVQKIKCISDRLYYYRIREDSIMGLSGREIHANQFNELAKELLLYYQNHTECEMFISVFSQIYYYIINSIVNKYRNLFETDICDIRSILLENIEDTDFFYKMMRSILKQKYFSSSIYSKREYYEMKNLAGFFCSGNSNWLRVKNKINYIANKDN